MVQLVLHRVYNQGHLCFDLPREQAYRESLARELRKCQQKHNDYILTTLQPPKRPRTTGPESQNHHLNGHIMQICNYTGHSYDEIKDAVKQIAVEQFGYPYTTICGKIVPQRERDCSIEDCAKLIEAVHYLAGFLGIILIEA